MNFAGNFNRIGTVDSLPLKELVLQLTPQHWVSESTRQKRYEVHRDTQSIGLVYDYDFRHSQPTRLPALQVFEAALRPVLAEIAAFYENSPTGKKLCEIFGLGYFIRASLVRLNPGGQIVPHRDKNFSLSHSHRVHLPVVTNDGVNFSVGNETINMREGEIYEINNRRLHHVRNDSGDGRVHLILDWVFSGEQCCCGEKTHPGAACNPRICEDTDRLKVPCTCFPENQRASAQVADARLSSGLANPRVLQIKPKRRH